MAFFDAPPPIPEAPKPPVVPAWFGPPERVLGGIVPQNLLMAKNDKAAVAITRLVAYPLGFSIELTMVSRSPIFDLPPVMPHFRQRPGETLENQFRFGMLYSDGTKVSADQLKTASGAEAWSNLAALEHPPDPMLRPSGGGGGSGNRWQWIYWATPLPPAGPLKFVVQWLAVEIPESSAEIDSQVILDAADSATPIWD